MVFIANFAACFTKIYKVMKKIYLCYLHCENYGRPYSVVIRVFSSEAHARSYCDYKNSNNEKSLLGNDSTYFYVAEDLLVGRHAESFLDTIMK